MKFVSLFLFLSTLVVAVKANGSAREAIEYFLSEVGLTVLDGTRPYDDQEYRAHVSQEISLFTRGFRQRFLGVNYEEHLPVICRAVIHGKHHGDNQKAAGCSVAMTVDAFEKLWIEVMTGIALEDLKHLDGHVLTYDMVFKGIKDFLNTRKEKNFEKYIPSTLVLNLCHQLVPKLIEKYGPPLTADQPKINAGCKHVVKIWKPWTFRSQ